eukprot:240215_1
MATHAEHKLRETVLVTGANGFIASHIIKTLLEKGYNVIGTVRNLQNHTNKYKYLYDFEITDYKNKLTLIQADLCKDTNWNNIIERCQYVMSVAAPVPSRESILVSTSDHINGIARILKFCLKHKQSLKRFIFTGSMDAHNYLSNNNPSVIEVANDSWTDIENLEVAHSYAKAKTLSEQYLWKFIKDNNNPFECVSINPGYVLGPLLEKRDNSQGVLKSILGGEFPFLPDSGMGFVDVRDVTDAHINALTAENVNGKRYVICNQFLRLKDVAIILKHVYQSTDYVDNITTNVQYSIVWKLIGKFDEAISAYIVPLLGRIIVIKDNKQTTKDLKLQYTPICESISDAAKSLIKFGLVEKPSILRKYIYVTTKMLIAGLIVGTSIHLFGKSFR